jgi:hypothetical protein
MHRFLAALVLLAGLSFACGGDEPDEDVEAAATPTLTATSEATSDKPTPANTPSAGSEVANEAFSVETPDGVVLKGHAYTPEGPKRQALIIFAAGDQSIWAESTRAFTSAGIAVFTVDLPGYGETGGEEADARTLATDVRLLTRFVVSREYPLVYVAGFGETGGALVTDEATFQDLQPVVGTITYGYAGESSTDTLSLAPEAAWDGEDVLADSAIAQQVLEFVLDGN